MPPIVPEGSAAPCRTACPRPAGSACHIGGWLVPGLVVLLLGVAMPPQVRAQIGVAAQPQLQVGLGGLPGAGVQIGYLTARSFFTVESVFYVEGTLPAFGEGNIHFSAGFGGAVRIFGLSRLLGSTAWYVNVYNVDLGLRIGPSLAFAQNETLADRNKRFSLFFEPFLRIAPSVAEGWALFVEVGPQRPSVRLGALWDF